MFGNLDLIFEWFKAYSCEKVSAVEKYISLWMKEIEYLN
jgi:hypothetical protein